MNRTHLVRKLTSPLNVLVLAVAAIFWAFSEAPTGHAATSQPASSSRPTSTPAARKVTEQQFLAGLGKSCAGCHKVCRSVDEMKSRGWIVPGKPDSSPVYTKIGPLKNKPNHPDLSAADKKVIRDFIEQLKP